MILLVAAALATGLPTLRGGFVGGDDHQLLLDHVLINHPSIEHAMQLFGIVHRDLYQPIPLLTFSMEFALAQSLGLFAAGEDGAAWLFHLTNVLLHALNTLAVWLVMLMLCRVKEDASPPESRRHSHAATASAGFVALIAGLIFAVHPLQVEVIAWLNGRMMLLSTLFALLSLLAMGRWLAGGRARWSVLTALFVLLSAISKIRIALPILLLVVPLARREKLGRRFWIVWSISTAITAVFVVVNIGATADAGMFDVATENLKGPPVVRSLVALGWYMEHFLWPVGLSAWYPAPLQVSWSDPATLRAIAVVLIAACLSVVIARRSRSAALAIAWILATLAVTLYLVQTRNALAADRYMYLPIIGMAWLVAMLAERARLKLMSRSSRSIAGVCVGLPFAAACVAMIATCWHLERIYETPIGKTERIATLFPDTSHVWERVAWAYYDESKYAEAISFAQREFEMNDAAAHSEAHRVIGMALVQMGDIDEGIASLRKAIDVYPTNARAWYRLAWSLDEAKRFDEAATAYERAVEIGPLFNPAINHLGHVNRRLGRVDAARAAYKKAIANNPYEVPAIMALAEMDIEEGTPPAHAAAIDRLRQLLNWMPENAKARTNLGAVLVSTGRREEAIEAYRTVLIYDAHHAPAALNLALLYYGSGDVEHAGPLFERVAQGTLESIEQVLAVHDFFVDQRAWKRTEAMWLHYLDRWPVAAGAPAYLAWSQAMSGDLAKGSATLTSMSEEDQGLPPALAVGAYLALAQERHDEAATFVSRLCAVDDASDDTRRRLMRSLEIFDERRANVPWTYCFVAQLMLANGEIESAALFAGLCRQHCTDPTCNAYAMNLEALTVPKPRK